MFAPMCKRISGPFKKTRSMRLCVLQILVYRVFAYGAILTYWLFPRSWSWPSITRRLSIKCLLEEDHQVHRRHEQTPHLKETCLSKWFFKMPWKASHRYHRTSAQTFGYAISAASLDPKFHISKIFQMHPSSALMSRPSAVWALQRGPGEETKERIDC